MSNDNVIDLKKPESLIEDPITYILRHEARKQLSRQLKLGGSGTFPQSP